jgi:hypothetical protein
MRPLIAMVPAAVIPPFRTGITSTISSTVTFTISTAVTAIITGHSASPENHPTAGRTADTVLPSATVNRGPSSVSGDTVHPSSSIWTVGVRDME